MTKVPELYGKWVFITPIGNVVLPEAVKGEFTVNRVLFVSRNKLPRIRKRLGINMRLSEIKRQIYSDLFNSAETFAVVRQSGRPAEIEPKCFRLVKDAISILALSQLGFSRRKFTGYIGLFGEHHGTTAHNAFLNTENPAMSFDDRLTRSPMPLRLDGTWKTFQTKLFFFKLLRILHRELRVDPQWRDDLERAAILIGQSVNTNDIAASFLWNMIALELLLPDPGRGKRKDTLPEFAEAFLGWSEEWEAENYQGRIQDLIEKRNDFVHDGKREKILEQDLLFLDDLLLNLLFNIVKYSNIFSSRQAIIDFVEKLSAERKLGLKPRVRPKGLTFVQRRTSRADTEETE